jgi:hypothetical protein
MEASVYLERYPIADVGSLRYHQLVAAARRALLGEDDGRQPEESAASDCDDNLGRAGGGVCMLPGFFKDNATRLAIDDALNAEPHAFRSDNEHNIYLEDEDEDDEQVHEGVKAGLGALCAALRVLCASAWMMPQTVAQAQA